MERSRLYGYSILSAGLCLLVVALLSLATGDKTALTPNASPASPVAPEEEGNTPVAKEEGSGSRPAPDAEESGEVTQPAAPVTGTIFGVVLDSDGGPVVGASVVILTHTVGATTDARSSARSAVIGGGPRALSWRAALGSYAGALSAALRTVTDDEGRYEVRSVPPGRYAVCVQHDGHLPDARRPVIVRGVERQRVDFSLHAGGWLGGRVVGPTGSPVAGATVRVEPSELGALSDYARAAVQEHLMTLGEVYWLKTTETGPDGTFLFGGLESKLHHVHIDAGDFARRTIPDVPPGSEELKVELPRGGTVRGRVRSDQSDFDSVRAFLIGVGDLEHVHAANSEELHSHLMAEAEGDAVPDDSGRFEVRGVRAGLYKLVVTSPEARPFLSEGIALDFGDEIDVGEVDLRPRAPIGGTVRNVAGDPVSEVQVRLLRAGDGKEYGSGIAIPSTAIGGVITSADGVFTFGALLLDVYDLEFWSPRHTPRFLEGVVAGTVDVVVELERGSTLRGLVLDALGDRPVEGALIQVQPYQQAVSDEEGRFEVTGIDVSPELPVAQLTLKAEAEGFALWRRVVKWEAASAEPLRIQLTRQITLVGVVLDQEGNGVAEAAVRLAVPGIPSHLVWEGDDPAVKSDAEGRFQLEVSSLDASGGPRKPRLVATHPSFADALSPPIDPIDSERFFELTFGAGGSVRGRVVADGEPVSSALVELVSPGPLTSNAAMALLFGMHDPLRRTWTNGQGGFSIDRVPPGAYRLEVSRQGYAPSAQSIEVEEGSVATEEIALDRGQVVHGRVMDGSGDPVPTAEVLAIPGELVHRMRHDLVNHIPFVAGVCRTRPDRDGWFTLGPLSPDKVIVAGRASGYKPAWIGDIEPGTRDNAIVLEKHTILTGRVRDRASGDPIPAFRVDLTYVRAAVPSLSSSRTAPSRPRSSKHRFHTAEGSFRLDELLTAQYLVRITAPGFAPYSVEVSTESGEAIVEAYLERGLRLSGQLVDVESKEPVQGARLRLVLSRAGARDAPPAGVVPAPVTSGTAGLFEFLGLGAGSYELHVRHPRYVTWTSTSMGVKEDTDLGLVSVSRSASLKVELSGWPHGARDINLVLTGSRGDVFRPTRIEERFRWDSLEPGKYKITATLGGHALALAPDEIALELGGDSMLSVQVIDDL